MLYRKQHPEAQRLQVSEATLGVTNPKPPPTGESVVTEQQPRAHGDERKLHNMQTRA